METPKAFANCSPGLEHSAATTLGIKVKEVLNPERVYCEANPFRVENNIGNDKPRVVAVLRSNPGLQLANAFGVILISRLYF